MANFVVFKKIDDFAVDQLLTDLHFLLEVFTLV